MTNKATPPSKMSRRAFFGAIFGAGATLALYSPKASACVPTIGAAIGRIIARIPGELIASVWDEWNERRNNEAEEDQAEAASLMITAGDSINHIENEVADNELRRKTAPLPKNCMTQESIEMTTALLQTCTATEDALSKTLDQATLTMSAPFVKPGAQAKEFERRFGKNWYVNTTHVNQLFTPVDIDESNRAQADAFILNATTKTARSAANMIQAYTANDARLFEQTAKVATFSIARAPLIRQRNYVTKYGGPSLRTSLHYHVNETYGNDGWRKSVRDSPSEVQALQNVVKQKAFSNHLKLLKLRELEVTLALQALIAIESTIARSQEGR